MEFLGFLARRLAWSLLVLVGLSVVIFVIARVVPGDPARMALGPRASAEQVADLQEKLGLNLPLYQQYGLFVGGLVRGELGQSLLTERSVNLDIRSTFPATLELVLVTVFIAFLFGVPLGVVAARWKDRWPDNLVRAFAIVAAVMPTFFIALLLQVLAGYGIRAITQKDLNAIMGVVMVSGLFFVLVNLLIDVLVGLVDPRIRIRGRRA